MAVIECIELSKSYSRHVTALKDINLSIEAGKSFGLLGENGAGKSTLVRIMMGFICPSSGRVRVFGEERVERVHSRIGYAQERPLFETRFSGRVYLTYLAQLSGLWDHANHVRVVGLLERVKLQEVAERAIGTYSKGMLQRLMIAQALLSDPDLLILDEPTSGLDPHSQWEIRQLILALRSQGKTIVLCSHNLAEVEELCDTVGILRRGQLILCGDFADLLHSQDIVEIALANDLPAWDIVSRLGIAAIEAQSNILRIASSSQPAVLSALLQAQIPILSLNPVSQTLEKVYVQTTQNSQDVPLVDAG